MLKSIKYKIWLTFLITLALCMSAMLMLTQISMRTGFLSYVTSQTVNKLEYIADDLIALYETQKSLDRLKGNYIEWAKLRHHAYKNIDLSEQPDFNSPPHLHQYNFVSQLVLTDENKTPLAGKLLNNANYFYHEVRTDNKKLIAHIAYIKPSDFLQSIDHHFLRQQLRSLATISIGVALVSLGVVLLLSRWLINPLTALSRIAKKLAAGEFNVRVDHQSNDELGELCRNFNELANTLSANEKARKQWVADISHEMRTPLAVVKAQIEAMQDGIRATNQESLSLLKDKIDALNLLINDLYELSLSDLGALSYNKEKLPFIDLIDHIKDDFVFRARGKNIDLDISNRLPESACVFGDANRLMQLLTNLIENSIHYTDAPGKIRIDASLEQNNIVVTIDDSKPGVSEDKRERIFERLFRVESSRNRNTGGSGLGLSICKNIVEAHEGSIKAYSSPLGGLQIKVKFPVVKV